MSPSEIEKLMAVLFGAAGSAKAPAGPSNTPSVKEYLSMQSSYLDLQRQFMELMSKSKALADELEGCRKRNADLGNYTLAEVAPGVVVMRALGMLVPHHLCPNCFANDRAKGFLQASPGVRTRHCPRCGAVFHFPAAADPDAGQNPPGITHVNWMSESPPPFMAVDLAAEPPAANDGKEGPSA